MRTVDTGNAQVNLALDEIWRVLDDALALDYRIRRAVANCESHLRISVPGETRRGVGDQSIGGDMVLFGDFVIAPQPGFGPPNVLSAEVSVPSEVGT
jgi:hypothetical protein